MLKAQLTMVGVTTVLFGIDFVIARKTGTQGDAGVTGAWLLSLGWLFGQGVADAIKKRNGRSGDD